MNRKSKQKQHAHGSVHVAHAAAARHRRRLVLLRLLDHDRLGGEQQAGDRSGVLQRRPGDLRRVDDAGATRSSYLVGARVVAVVGWSLLRTFSTTIEPSTPAFCAIWRIGSSSARSTIRTPICSSASSSLNS
jgi:hypothetical protein